MTPSSKKSRIIFIDLMRAFAVLQMVQGHTTDVLLANIFRNTDFVVYNIWLFNRGLTAPIFMFTAGTVFTYLFRLRKEKFSDNPRLIKGVKRAGLLLLIGYLLRFPTANIFDFSSISPESWRIFFVVDVLHLIGMSLLILLGLLFFTEKLKINEYIVYLIGTLLLFGFYPFAQNINWNEFLPAPIAGYFYNKTGSLFPLFPWAGYVISGSILGSYLAVHPDVFKSPMLSLRLAVSGLILVILASVSSYFVASYYPIKPEWFEGVFTIALRLGIVLLLNSVVSLISLKIETIPRFIILIGRNTLLIYVVHLVILYGSAWNFGINYLWGKSFGVWLTVGSAITMILLMTAMVLIIHKFKIKNKELVTS